MMEDTNEYSFEYFAHQAVKSRGHELLMARMTETFKMHMSEIKHSGADRDKALSKSR